MWILIILAVLAIFLTMKASKYTIQIRKDEPENTIKAFDRKSPDECKIECDKMQECKGFVSYTDKTCILKSSIKNMIDKDGSMVFIK